MGRTFYYYTFYFYMCLLNCYMCIERIEDNVDAKCHAVTGGELIIQTIFKAILTIILINHANGVAEK